MTLKSRIEALERKAQPRARRWSPAVVETRPGVDVSALVARVRADAVAAGWCPGAGPVVVIVTLGGEEGEHESEKQG